MTSKIAKATTKDQATPIEEVIFDADKDNGGKGVSPDEMTKILKREIHAHGRTPSLQTAGQIIL